MWKSPSRRFCTVEPLLHAYCTAECRRAPRERTRRPCGSVPVYVGRRGGRLWRHGARLTTAQWPQRRRGGVDGSGGASPRRRLARGAVPLTGAAVYRTVQLARALSPPPASAHPPPLSGVFLRQPWPRRRRRGARACSRRHCCIVVRGASRLVERCDCIWAADRGGGWGEGGAWGALQRRGACEVLAAGKAPSGGPAAIAPWQAAGRATRDAARGGGDRLGGGRDAPAPAGGALGWWWRRWERRRPSWL